MLSLVLKYLGDPAERDTAETSLRALIPGADLTRKTRLLVEARVDEDQAATLAQQPDWEVSQPTYADIGQPVMGKPSNFQTGAGHAAGSQTFIGRADQELDTAQEELDQDS